MLHGGENLGFKLTELKSNIENQILLLTLLLQNVDPLTNIRYTVNDAVEYAVVVIIVGSCVVYVYVFIHCVLKSTLKLLWSHIDL